MREYSWKMLSEYIRPLSQEFSLILDELDPSDEYKLYLATYPYGALILDKGIFQIINNEGHLVPLGHSSISKRIMQDLTYTGTMPVGMITSNSIETFFVTHNRTIPSSLFSKGQMISLWSALEASQTYHAGPMWSVSSGTRTICLIPKISDKIGHHNLRAKYNLKTPIPQHLTDHWEILQTLANHSAFPQKWESEIIFFSKKWFEHQKDKKWANFYRYLLNEVWQGSMFRRNQFIFDFAFSLVEEKRNLKPNPYLADTVKHLIGIGTGEVPGLAPAINDEAAPIRGLQKIFIEDYRLKKYAPVIMHVHHLTANDTRKLYYSLEMPTTTIFSPRSSRLSSKMVDMRETQDILEVLLAEIIKGSVYVEKTPLYNLARDIKYSFYHCAEDIQKEILPITELFKIDASFTRSLVDAEEYAIPEFSPFFRGCITISKSSP